MNHSARVAPWAHLTYAILTSRDRVWSGLYAFLMWSAFGCNSKLEAFKVRLKLAKEARS